MKRLSFHFLRPIFFHFLGTLICVGIWGKKITSSPYKAKQMKGFVHHPLFLFECPTHTAYPRTHSTYMLANHNHSTTPTYHHHRPLPLSSSFLSSALLPPPLPLRRYRRFQPWNLRRHHQRRWPALLPAQ